MFSRVLCPLCEKTARRFRAFGGGTIKRPNAQCPHCASLERHRLIWLYLRNETDLFSGTQRKRMLHIAPEPALHERLVGEPLIDYLSADLDPGLADVQMDITAIDFPADSFGAAAPLCAARSRARLRPGLRRPAARGGLSGAAGPLCRAAGSGERAALRGAGAGSRALLHEDLSEAVGLPACSSPCQRKD